MRPKLLEFNRMTDETDYNKQADLLVGAYRRVNDMVQQTRTAEVKKIRALLKDKIAGGKGTGAGRPTIFFFFYCSKLCSILNLDNLVTQEALNQVHLDSFFDAKYEEATDTVKELFLFVYSDCPEGMSANIASKTGKKVDQGRYETMVSRADISLIRLVLWLEVVKKEWKAQEAAEGTDEEGGGNGQRRQSRRNQNQENNESNSNQEGAVANGNTEAAVNKEKSKGGRPAKTPSVEKYIPKFEEYLLEEVKMRVSAAKKEALAQSWYDAALENINKKVKSQKDQNKKSIPDLNPAGGNTKETSSTTQRVSQSLLADIMKEEVGDWAKV